MTSPAPPCWLPGRVLVRFVRDAALLCERLVLGVDPTTTLYVVVGPDREPHLMDFTLGKQISEVLDFPMGQRRCPLGIKSKDCFLAREHACIVGGGGSPTIACKSHGTLCDTSFQCVGMCQCQQIPHMKRRVSGLRKMRARGRRISPACE